MILLIYINKHGEKHGHFPIKKQQMMSDVTAVVMLLRTGFIHVSLGLDVAVYLCAWEVCLIGNAIVGAVFQDGGHSC